MFVNENYNIDEFNDLFDYILNSNNVHTIFLAFVAFLGMYWAFRKSIKIINRS